MPKTYIIQDKNGYKIQLSTDQSKLDSLEMLMLLIAAHFTEKGKADRLGVILNIIQERMENL